MNTLIETILMKVLSARSYMSELSTSSVYLKFNRRATLSKWAHETPHPNLLYAPVLFYRLLSANYILNYPLSPSSVSSPLLFLPCPSLFGSIVPFSHSIHIPWGQDLGCFAHSCMYSQPLEPFLPHDRCSGNFCWKNEWNKCFRVWSFSGRISIVVTGKEPREKRSSLTVRLFHSSVWNYSRFS